ncbi:RNA/RNP complex-1-interacting phosphatase-like [Stegodyphus dumicola]|uniref:RNA/RNP complex-1-interacting phosphatase-like n=1 Tax=Stegodyphus dumicola TaxID=202533 RepID=UPI0015ADCAC1|nr:RNA/RNP complex-1-interacting phosphatase-like [Stegodyphus dumicola]
MGRQKKIPDGWLDYYPIKDIVYDARIVPFKCPLPERLFQNSSIVSYKWTPSDVMQRVPNLGMVIDLTFKFPAYYNPQEFLDCGVQYKKIGCVGHDVPKEENFFELLDTVESFMISNARNDLVIGLHCTHGVNRTGYMLCRLLVERLRYTPGQALEAFACSRGYPLERENYREAIYNLQPR